MQHPNDLKRKRRGKSKIQLELNGAKDNEKSEMSQNSQARRREAKLQAK